MKLNKTKADAGKGASNAAKTLLANIRFMSVDKPIKTIVFTSAIPNEGKTFVATNTAIAMATSGRRTLIVDADMRRRSVARALNIHVQHGIYSVLAGEVSLEEAAVETSTRRLFFLDTEPNIPNPSDLIGSRRYARFIQEVRERFDFVVFDTPPLCTFVDAAVLSTMVDAVFMVVRERFAKKDEIQNAANQLKQANAPLMGAVMNCCAPDSSGYYYNYYYKENDKSDSSSKTARHAK